MSSCTLSVWVNPDAVYVPLYGTNDAMNIPANDSPNWNDDVLIDNYYDGTIYDANFR